MNKSHPQKLLDAAQLIAANKLKKAEPILREHLIDNPLDVNAMKLLADIGIRFRAYKDAGYLLTRALDLAPDFDLARLSYANLLYKRQLPFESLRQINILLEKDSKNLHYLTLKAVNLALANNHEDALVLFEDINRNFPNHNQLHLSYGHTLRAVGRVDEAIIAYKKAISLNYGYGEAYWSLANLKTYNFEDADINNINLLLINKDCLIDDYYHLLFALGKAEEDRKNFKHSIAAYIKGNSVKGKQVPWRYKDFRSECNELMDFFTKDFFDKYKGVGDKNTDPIFIVGLPRSGSTLIEQILSSHSLVEGTTELQNIIALSRKIANKKNAKSRSEYPSEILNIDKKDFEIMGSSYLNNTLDQRITDKPYFIDKMPNNFSHIGLIQLILPNAKIIDARRNPMDCSFSCYKQLFGSGQGFTYGFERIGNYYLDYLTIMRHWDKVLPGKVHRVIYENMINNTENEIRQLLKFCNLDFEDGCLEFYKNKRTVRTPSSEQVRQPIYRSGMKQWENYREWLQPLAETLGMEDFD
jgi:tetratricopeptide (TPR) repeat protein